MSVVKCLCIRGVMIDDGIYYCVYYVRTTMVWYREVEGHCIEGYYIGGVLSLPIPTTHPHLHLHPHRQSCMAWNRALQLIAHIHT